MWKRLECFRPDVTEAEVEEVANRVRHCEEELARTGTQECEPNGLRAARAGGTV